MKLFGPPTTKWRPCKVFAKLNGNHLLMANIFKLHEYKTFGLMKMHNMSKIWYANNIFSLWKRLVYDQRAVENAIFYFLPFPFPQISKDLSKILKRILRVLSNFYYITNIFDLCIFENEKTALLFFFQYPWICILVLYFF